VQHALRENYGKTGQQAITRTKHRLSRFFLANILDT